MSPLTNLFIFHDRRPGYAALVAETGSLEGRFEPGSIANYLRDEVKAKATSPCAASASVSGQRAAK